MEFKSKINLYGYIVEYMGDANKFKFYMSKYLKHKKLKSVHFGPKLNSKNDSSISVR